MTEASNHGEDVSADQDELSASVDSHHDASDHDDLPDRDSLADAQDSADGNAVDFGDAPELESERIAHKQFSRLLRPIRTRPWGKVTVYGLLPIVAFALALGSGYLTWQDSSKRSSQRAGVEAAAAARDSVAAILSYKPDTVDKDLVAAENRLTGKFRDAYTQLIKDVVIPGSKQGNITATATIPATAVASAAPSRVVVLVFVDQTTTVGTDPPSDTASSVRVTVDKIGRQWLISDFVPV